MRRKPIIAGAILFGIASYITLCSQANDKITIVITDNKIYETEDTSEYVMDTGESGEFRSSVEEIQLRLIDYGYLDGEADGKYGPNTANAISLFQEDCGLPPSGFIDLPTYSAMINRRLAELSLDVKGAIQFREIPWGASYTFCSDYLGSKKNTRPREVEDDFSRFAPDEVLRSRYGYAYTYPVGIEARYLVKHLQVAGYVTQHIFLYFAQDVNGGLALSMRDPHNLKQGADISGRVPKKALLYGAIYEIELEGQDPESAKSDLIQKLSTLYGDPIDDPASTSEITIWNDQDTHVSLYSRYDDKRDKTTMYICYSWDGGDKLMSIADDYVSENREKETERTIDSDNSSGL